jgi:hypothetical protein
VPRDALLSGVYLRLPPVGQDVAACSRWNTFKIGCLALSGKGIRVKCSPPWTGAL